MTTIATDGKSMAGDSRITARNEWVGDTIKIHKAKDGRIFGCCGASADRVLFGAHINGENAEPKLSDDFSALVLNADGTVDYYYDKLVPIRYLTPMAIGSGGDFALGAMLAGKSPAEAVGIAALRDLSTGGDITTISIGANNG